MGALGTNDHFSFLSSNRTVEQARAYVPTIVDSISRGVEVLYREISFFCQVCNAALVIS
jgi:hypothetical protein